MVGLLLAFAIFNSQLSIGFAAVAFDASGTGANSDSISTLSYTHTVVAGSNRLLICSVAYAPTGALRFVSGMTYGGAGLTFKSSQESSSTNGKVEMWYLVAPATGANTAQVTFSGTVDGAAFDCTSFTGVDAGTPLGTATTTNDMVTGLSCTVPSSGLCYDVSYAAYGNNGCAGRAVQTGGQTERFDICWNNGLSNSIEHMASTRTTTGTMSWDHDSGNYEGQIAVPINNATGAAPSVRRMVVTVQ